MLVAGRPKSAVAVQAFGMTARRFEALLKADATLNALIEFAGDIGLARFEAELHDRALAGAGDRGSPRALEMVLKRHFPEYRDKAQVEMTHILRAAEAWSGATADLPAESAT